jgi:hypothetical protein
MEDVYWRLRQTAIAEVARRGTTFTALREQIEAQYGRQCSTHGIDGHEYRVQFVERNDHPDLGIIPTAYDYTLDLSRPDTEWVAVMPYALDPSTRELLACL